MCRVQNWTICPMARFSMDVERSLTIRAMRAAKLGRLTGISNLPYGVAAALTRRLRATVAVALRAPGALARVRDTLSNMMSRMVGGDASYRSAAKFSTGRAPPRRKGGQH